MLHQPVVFHPFGKSFVFFPAPRHVVQEIIKEMAKSRPIGADGQRSFKVGAFLAVDYAAPIGGPRANHLTSGSQSAI
jgi:hypothetical protein